MRTLAILNILALSALTFIIISFTQVTNASEGMRGKGPQGGPPPEAFEACSSSNNGDSCTVNTPHGTLNGTCGTPPEETQLVCMPEHHRNRNNGDDDMMPRSRDY